ncbi:MAG: TonB family protein [Terriglobales bacterium]
MAPIPPLTPTPPESAGARVPARNRSEIFEESIQQSNANLVYVKLRKMIASDAQTTDTVLGAIAVAAHSLTGATGAAVAMPRDGAVVCVGRSGETAPELGARLNVDSGISGECLRTGVIMRCDDASRDFHVDAEVCRQLGLQSIAVVPLRGQYGRVGVLEAFSTESYAFTEEKMDILGRLAGLAEAAWARGAVAKAPLAEEPVAVAPLITPIVETPVQEFVPVVDPVPLAEVREALAPFAPPASRFPGKWGYPILAGVALLAVVLLSVYGWKAWYRSSIASKSAPPVAGSSMAATESGDAAAEVSSPSFGQAGMPSKESPAIPVTKTAQTGGASDLVRRQARSARSANRKAQSNSLAAGDDVPQLAASNADPADLEKALVATPALPQLGVPVSQGTAGGVLVHKVQPLYPAEARRMHVQGDVVIDAVVTAQGQVNDLKLVSGDPMLAQAAMDAVRRWRYTPYSLNGQPIPKETRITISFIAPQ